MPNIGIFSLEADLHAHAVLHELKQLGAKGHFFATDAQIEDGGVSWRSGADTATVLRDYDGNAVDMADLSLIWWRRVNQPQKEPAQFADPAAFDLVCSEWRGALFGAVSDSFKGIWVNDPKHDALAGNKLFQLKAAQRAGFRVPHTLVSNDPDEVVAFCLAHDDAVIAKKIQGAGHLSLATVTITAAQARAAADSIRLAPAMYQERIVSTRHVRANCFGDRVFSVLIESDDLDWRRNLNCRFSAFELGEAIDQHLITLLADLNLRMGIMDLILVGDDIVWLEINPQGQFLFAEGLSGLDLKRHCAAFMHGLACAH